MLKVTNLTKTYFGSEVKAVDDLSFEAHEGEILGFLGSNGSGKSTTIKSIVGILPFEFGKISISNIDLAKNPQAAKKQIGFVPDSYSIFERLTGREYLNHMGSLYGVSATDLADRSSKLLALFKLEHAIDLPIKSYSQGMKQKISTIASLIHKPKLWILDEPLTNLDPQSAFKLKKLMRYYADQGNIVFFSSHILDVVENLCDKICVISKGKLQGIYKLDDLKKEKYSLEKLFMEISNDDLSFDEDFL